MTSNLYYAIIPNLEGVHMAKKTIYAIKKGKQTGLFYSWNECKEAVNGYSGAEYKGFETEEEAKDYLENKVQEIKAEEREEIIDNKLVAYVDGSFDEKIGKYAFGCIILTPRGETIKESGNGNEPDSLAIRNVAGEMLGAMYAVQWAINNGYHDLEIHYDYEGIEKWAQGEWRTKNVLTKKYADFMKEKSGILKISYQKVKAHSGNHYNEEVDKLAKIALTEGNGIPKVKRGDFWFTVEGISDEDLSTVIELVIEEIGENNLIIEKKDIAHGNVISIKSSKNKDRVVVTHYKRSDKVVMQGKPKEIFSTIIGYITELIEVEEIPRIFNNTYNLNIDKDEVHSEFQFYMPNAYDRLPSKKMERVLHQAVYNLKITGDLFDGTYLAQPAMRVVEAQLKSILIECGIIPNARYVKENSFDMFDKVGIKYKLKPDRYGNAKPEQIKYIGNIYTFYNSNRHSIEHWDDPIAPIDTTELLNVERAHDLIKRALAIIDEYYEEI